MRVHVLRVLVYPALCLGIDLFFRWRYSPLAPWEQGQLFVLTGGLLACFDAFSAMARSDPEADAGGRFLQAWGAPALGLWLSGLLARSPLVWFPLVTSALCAALGLALTRRLARGTAAALGYGTLALWLTVPCCPLNLMLEAGLYGGCCRGQMTGLALLVSVAWSLPVTWMLLAPAHNPLIYPAGLLGALVLFPCDDNVWWLRMCALVLLAVLHTLDLVVRGGPSGVPLVGLLCCILALVPLGFWYGWPNPNPLPWGLICGAALCLLANSAGRWREPS